MSETQAQPSPIQPAAEAASEPQSQPEPQPRASMGSKLWNGWIKPVGAAVLAVVIFRSAVADWNDVPSQSMEPTILVGDRIFVNKLAYDLKLPFTSYHIAEWSGPQRGDIVVFFSPNDGKRMVKRVAAIPGDTIAMRDNRLYINHQLVEYGPIEEAALGVAVDELADRGPHQFAAEKLRGDGGTAHAMMTQPTRPARRSFLPQVVPDGNYFMLGDNRDNSGDSRIFGFVPRDKIMGKAVGLAFSLDQANSYSPRWERFFRGLH